MNNIRNNATELKQWIRDEITDKKELLNYLLHKCSVVQLKVKEISEAFQMFDSQNGRGLPLEPYNLLKAYHLRYFELLPQQEKIRYDQSWEKAAKNKDKKDYLKQVISEHLYRTRTWSKNYSAYSFTKNTLGEFKGAAVGHIKYPYQNFVNYFVFNPADADVPRMEHEPIKVHTQINQLIVNGVPFFDYINNYVVMYQLLFRFDVYAPLNDFYIFYKEYCSGFTKKGDYYLLELYKSMIMLVYDKFGANGLLRYYSLLYAYVFRFRLEKKFVKYKSVAQFPSGAITRIHNAQQLLDLNFLKDKALAPIERQESNTNNDIVEQFFQNHFNVKIS